jgi:hypothetical protein
MVFSINAGAEGTNNSFSIFQGTALGLASQFANVTANTTNTTTASGSKASSTGIGGSSSSGAISMNIDGANAMLMAGLGMVVSLMV